MPSRRNKRNIHSPSPLATSNQAEASISLSPERPRGVDSTDSPQVLAVPQSVDTSAVLHREDDGGKLGDASVQNFDGKIQTQILDRSSDFVSLQDGVDAINITSSMNSLTLDEPKIDQWHRTSAVS